MNFLKVISGKVELCDNRGSKIRNIVNSNATSADLNQTGDMILIIYENGKVELLDDRGSKKANIATDCQNAKFSGNEIIVTKKSGKMELLDLRGSKIRNL